MKKGRPRAGESGAGDWDTAYLDDKAAGGGLSRTWETCQDAASPLIETDSSQREDAKRIGLCYAQQMLAHRPSDVHRIILKELLVEVNAVAKGKENG